MASYSYLEATAQVKIGYSKLKSIFVSSGTSPTIVIYDSATANTGDPVVLAQFTAAVPSSYNFPPEGISLSKGLYVALGGTNPKVTILYE